MTPTLPTIDEIAYWLRALPPDTIVGECRSAFGCLIATYLKSKYAPLIFSVQIGNERIEYVSGHDTDEHGHFPTHSESNNPFIPMPFGSPLSDLARAFDRHGGSYTGGRLAHRAMTAKATIRIIEKMEDAA